jgi:signal transduction histidine kinase
VGRAPAAPRPRQPALQRHQVQLFERWKRGRDAASRVAGNGIALSGVKQTVEQHRGTIAVASREGEGSVFTIFNTVP